MRDTPGWRWGGDEHVTTPDPSDTDVDLAMAGRHPEHDPVGGELAEHEQRRPERDATGEGPAGDGARGGGLGESHAVDLDLQALRLRAAPLRHDRAHDPLTVLPPFELALGAVVGLVGVGLPFVTFGRDPRDTVAQGVGEIIEARRHDGSDGQGHFVSVHQVILCARKLGYKII
jgi:hypothetical protein